MSQFVCTSSLLLQSPVLDAGLQVEAIDCWLLQESALHLSSAAQKAKMAALFKFIKFEKEIS